MNSYIVKSYDFNKKTLITKYKPKTYINFYDKFLGFLIKKGKKINAKKTIENSFFYVSKKTRLSKKQILVFLFEKLNCFVEVRKIRIKRRTHFVPFSIKIKRRLYLVVKWLMKSISLNKKKISTSKKLANEILAVFKNLSNSKVLRLKRLNNNQSVANRSNIHFRW